MTGFKKNDIIWRILAGGININEKNQIKQEGETGCNSITDNINNNPDAACICGNKTIWKVF